MSARESTREVGAVDASADPRRVPVLLAGLLGGAGASALVYRVVSEHLIDEGTVIAEPDFPGSVRAELLRYGPWILIAAALVTALVALRRRGRADLRSGAGAFVFAAGLAWFVLSSFDMHVLEIYDWSDDGSHVLEDLAYHGGGAIVAAIGWLMVFPNGTKRT